MDEELKDYYVPQIFRKVFCEHSKEQPRERRRKDRMKKIGFDNDKYLKMQSEHIMLPVFFQALSQTASCAC